jgi:hypothetical protein
MLVGRTPLGLMRIGQCRRRVVTETHSRRTERNDTGSTLILSISNAIYIYRLL